jgi:hypothetical protein
MLAFEYDLNGTSHFVSLHILLTTKDKQPQFPLSGLAQKAMHL